MSIGSTTDKGDPKKNIVPKEIKDAKVLTDADADMRTLEELRGIATKMEKGYENLHEAKLSLNEKATVEGIMVELDVMRQRSKQQAEQMNRLIGMYGTLQAEFTQYKEQRIRELNVRVNCGSTSPEDLDGSIA